MAKDPLQKNVQDAITGLNELKLAFEQYFMGMERVPPLEQRTKYAGGLRTLKETPMRNTATKFQVNNLWSKFQTYDQMWNRVLKEIEEGTYKRDKFRVGLLKKKQKSTSNGQDETPDVVELDDIDFDVEDGEEAFRPAAPAPVPVAPRPAQPVAAALPKVAVPAAPGSALAAFAQRTGVQLQPRPGAPVPAGAPTAPPQPRPVAPNAVPGAQPRPAGAVAVTGVGPRPAGAPGAVPSAVPRPAGVPAPAPRPAAPGAAAPRPAVAAAPNTAARPASSGGDMPDDYVRRIEKTLSETRKKIGDQTETNFDVLKAQLSKQVPLIKQQHGAKSVEFQVVVKDGKAILKAIPKK